MTLEFKTVEGGYYKRRNGEVVGPLARHKPDPEEPADGVEAWSAGVTEDDKFNNNGNVWSTHITSKDLVEYLGQDNGTDIGTPLGEPDGNARRAGIKHDAEKPWAGTVLAGFWCDDLRAVLKARLVRHGSDRAAIVSAIDAALDPNIGDFESRLVSARAYLSCDQGCGLSGAILVGTYGAHKYARDNWLSLPDGVNRCYEALGRHVQQILEGKWLDTPDDPSDPGSGLPNIHHICWCIYAGAKLADLEGEK